MKTLPQLRADGGRPQLALRAVPVTVQAAAGDTTAPRRFSLVANTGEPMRIWPWEHPVVVDLDTVDLTAQLIPALYDHCPDVDYVVGQVESIRVENGQLLADGRFVITDAPIDRNLARQVLDRADAGYVWQASIGGDPATVETVQAGQSVVVNGRTYAGPICVARGVVLREISFVVLGGDRRTSAVVSRQALQGGSTVDFETWVMSLGFDPASLTDQQRAALQVQYNQLHPAETETETETETVASEGGTETTTTEEEQPTNATARRPVVQGRTQPSAVMAHRRAIAAEEARIDSVRRICAANNNPEIEVGPTGNRRRVNLQAHAIAEGWSATRTELEALRAIRGSGPAVIVRSHERDCTVQALTAAVLLRSGRRIDHPALRSRQATQLLPDWLRADANDVNRNRILEAAGRFDDMSLVDLCREAVRLDGREAPYNRSNLIRAAFSGSSLTNIFTTNVNAALLTSYVEAADTTESWTTTTDVADFKTNERTRVNVGPGLSKLPRGGEADHADFDDNLESYKIARYAKQFVVDEQDVIDDRLGALADTPTRLGQAAARLRPDLVYAILLANPTLNATSRALFNATDGNTSASAALSASTLRSAIQAMMAVRENSVNLNLAPTHLIVPTDLIMLAKELVASPNLILAGTAGSVTERGNLNVITDMGITPVGDARLSNGVTDPDSGTAYAGSTSTWYLASTLAHTIEVAYRRGTGRAPQVRSWIMDREGKYGMGWDVSLDIGAKALDWKGLLRRQQ